MLCVLRVWERDREETLRQRENKEARNGQRTRLTGVKRGTAIARKNVKRAIYYYRKLSTMFTAHSELSM